MLDECMAGCVCAVCKRGSGVVTKEPKRRRDIRRDIWEPSLLHSKILLLPVHLFREEAILGKQKKKPGLEEGRRLCPPPSRRLDSAVQSPSEGKTHSAQLFPPPPVVGHRRRCSGRVLKDLADGKL